MNIVRDLSAAADSIRHGAVSIGNFDGVHLGHAQLIERLTSLAQRVGGPAVVFTFDPHPAHLLRPNQVPPPLTWLERKAELLGKLGVDVVAAYPTDEKLLALEPAEFYDHVLRRQLVAKAIVEGPNFRFGCRRAGDINTLRELTQADGVTLEVVEPAQRGGEYISSSRIRTALAAGDVDGASSMLTEPYRLRGFVVHGLKRGRTIGFPTANLEGIDTLLPAPGVYAGWAYPSSGRYPAAIHIGPNVTFAESALKVEVHLIGFQGELYGAPLEVDFRRRVRDSARFAGIDALQAQLQRDVAETQRWLESRL